MQIYEYFLQEIRHGSIYEQYLWNKCVLRAKEGTEESSKRTCVWLLVSALTSNSYKSTLTYCQTFEKPLLWKEQHFVALRQQGSLQSHFYIHMQANNPGIGLEKYYFITTNTTKLIDMMSILYIVRGLFLSNTAMLLFEQFKTAK